MYSSDFRRLARENLRGNWGVAIGGLVVLTLISAVISALSMIPFVGFIFVIINLILSGPIWIGFAHYFNQLVKSNAEVKPAFEDFFKGFSNFWRNSGVYLLMLLKLFLWFLLFYVPGIIKTFAYALTPYIRLDYPELTANQCIKLSNEMMKGYKWRLFCLYFSFIGWAILCVLSLGIGFLWLAPYQNAAVAAFYQHVKEKYEANKT